MPKRRAKNPNVSKRGRRANARAARQRFRKSECAVRQASFRSLFAILYLLFSSFKFSLFLPLPLPLLCLCLCLSSASVSVSASPSVSVYASPLSLSLCTTNTPVLPSTPAVRNCSRRHSASTYPAGSMMVKRWGGPTSLAPTFQHACSQFRCCNRSQSLRSRSKGQCWERSI